MVRADGVVAKAGGRVVKNVAGYDLGKLLIGSAGTLGVITDATFRLHPVPAASRWVTAPVADPAAALRDDPGRVHAQVVPAAVEVEWAEGAGSVAVLLEGRVDGVAGRAEPPARCSATGATELRGGPGGRCDVPLGHERLR